MQKLMLYYHIPFCVSKCAYCAFFSIPCADKALKDQYTQALIKQTNAFKDADKCTVSSVYFGGGTPSVLGADNIASVLFAVYSTFSLANDAEITVEVNPCTIDENGLTVLKKAGVNRLSIGAQSFNDATLRLLNRPHDADGFISCYKSAIRAGFDNISADLIFALPNEGISDLGYSLKRLISLEPNHISVYSLSIEDNTPLCESKNLYRFPTEDEEEEQYELVCNTLASAGYDHYEISNFAKPGCEAKHNTGYWQRIPYFGFGAGAYSFFQNRRFSSPADINAYIQAVNFGFTAPTDFDKTEPVSDAEAEEERIMLGLRLAKGIKINKPVPKQLLDNGLITVDNGIVMLTEKGFRVSNPIIGMLI